MSGIFWPLIKQPGRLLVKLDLTYYIYFYGFDIPQE